MALIFTTALIAITALALPNPISTLLPRDNPPALGDNSNSTFYNNLLFTLYAERDCKESKKNPARPYNVYGLYEAYQMQSYRLSRPLYEDEILDFYSGGTEGIVNNTVDHNLDGHYSKACWAYDVRAGVDATTHDGGAESHGRDQGCHTLKKNEWCAIIWINTPS